MAEYCPDCGTAIHGATECDCGWGEKSRRGRSKAAHVEDTRCAFTVDGRRCFMPGTISGDTSGNPGHREIQRTHYCAWHWQFVQGAAQRYLTDQHEFGQWLRRRRARTNPWQRSIWLCDARALWERVTGNGSPTLTHPPTKDIRDIAKARGVGADTEQIVGALRQAGINYEPGSDEPVVWGDQHATARTP